LSWGLLDEFEWCDELGCFVSESAVDFANVIELAGIGNVAAVPGHEHIAFVQSGERQMQSVARRKVSGDGS
jgi:hypothetical protein